MKKVYFGFALADSMFDGDCMITRRDITSTEVVGMAGDLTSCCNASHKATIDAMRARFGINVPIPATPPLVVIGDGESIIVMGVRGLPRLTDRHEYTAEEIDSASFRFTRYEVTYAP